MSTMNNQQYIADLFLSFAYRPPTSPPATSIKIGTAMSIIDPPTTQRQAKSKQNDIPKNAPARRPLPPPLLPTRRRPQNGPRKPG